MGISVAREVKTGGLDITSEELIKLLEENGHIHSDVKVVRILDSEVDDELVSFLFEIK